ncbi:hypothetical protein [Paenibacillus sp. BAC0078]
MSNEKNLYISYLDEAKIENKGPVRKYTIASMTAAKRDYVDDIEVKWSCNYQCHVVLYSLARGSRSCLVKPRRHMTGRVSFFYYE